MGFPWGMPGTQLPAGTWSKSFMCKTGRGSQAPSVNSVGIWRRGNQFGESRHAGLHSSLWGPHPPLSWPFYSGLTPSPARRPRAQGSTCLFSLRLCRKREIRLVKTKADSTFVVTQTGCRVTKATGTSHSPSALLPSAPTPSGTPGSHPAVETRDGTCGSVSHGEPGSPRVSGGSRLPCRAELCTAHRQE